MLKVKDDSGHVYTLKNFRPQDFESDINRWFTKEDCDKMKNSLPTGCKIHIVYRLDINEYRGNRNLEYMLEYYLPA